MNWRVFSTKIKDKNPNVHTPHNIFEELIEIPVDSKYFQSHIITTEKEELYINLHNYVIGGFKTNTIFKNPFFVNLSSNFIESLQETDLLLISGYSFSDDHINNLIVKSLKKDSIIIMVNPNLDRISECFQYLRDFSSKEPPIMLGFCNTPKRNNLINWGYWLEFLKHFDANYGFSFDKLLKHISLKIKDQYQKQIAIEHIEPDSFCIQEGFRDYDDMAIDCFTLTPKELINYTNN